MNMTFRHPDVLRSSGKERRAGLDDGRSKQNVSESYTVVRTCRIGTLKSAGEQDGENMRRRWQQGVEGNIRTLEIGTKRTLEKLMMRRLTVLCSSPNICKMVK